ncbi:MAG TPA: MFS transporter [Flavisolibacter sp.]|jgi:ACS family hexuronate transporter-like MFS transporter|nr:MFS transporter [Flavisolibacter sp.]
MPATIQTETVPLSGGNLNQAIGKYRWTICGLIFFATTINYIDRNVISYLKSTFTDELGWNDADYTNVEITFKIFYAIGMLGAGRIIDRLGTKIGYGLFITLWSVAGVATALVQSVLGFQVVRGALGVAESGNFPAAIKTVAEWFPKKERALATGIFNSGANIGAIVTPLCIPWMVVNWGWKWAFISTGLLGFVWLVFWLIVYEIPARHKKLSKEEFAYIESDKDEDHDLNEAQPKLGWGKLLGYRQTWAFVIGKFLTDPIWWFYLFWLPDFFESVYKIKLQAASWPVAVVYLISTLGSVGGGWLPLNLIQKGTPVFKARKSSMLLYAFLVLPIFFALILGRLNIWYAVGVIGIAAAAHQAWSANIFTTVSDMFPKHSTDSVTGLGGMAGGLGGIALSLFVQKQMFVHYRAIGQIETAYYIMFAICASAYLLAWVIMHFLVPKMKRIEP